MLVRAVRGKRLRTWVALRVDGSTQDESREYASTGDAVAYVHSSGFPRAPLTHLVTDFDRRRIQRAGDTPVLSLRPEISMRRHGGNLAAAHRFRCQLRRNTHRRTTAATRPAAAFRDWTRTRQGGQRCG